MSEPILWRDDGTPTSPRFGDIYRSHSGALAQARHVFLAGCGLPEAWRGQPRWIVLETGFGLGLNFLAVWQAWRDDPDRPQTLHVVSVEGYPASAADVRRSAADDAGLQPLADQLAEQWWGLSPGLHRLEFEGGRVQLTLCIGPIHRVLKELQFLADSVFLDGFKPQLNPEMWDEITLKGVSRLCRPGTRLATWTVARAVRDRLTALGFDTHKAPGQPPKRDCLQAHYAPRWTPRRAAPCAPHWPTDAPREAVVIGAGLAGASCAFALARRGWQVQVVDAADTAASGASGLPCGLFSDHVDIGDGRISRLTRTGLRMVRHWADSLLKAGQDWGPAGVLEHRLHGRRGPALEAGQDLGSVGWATEASTGQKQSVGLPPDAALTWHPHAGWIRTPDWVRALLGHHPEHIRWVGGRPVASCERDEQGLWCLRDAAGRTLASARLVVIAAGPHSPRLSEVPMPVQAIRGQLSWAAADPASPWPPTPVNGQGSFIVTPASDRIPARWHTGSTFDRAHALPAPGQATPCYPADHVLNLAKLGRLLPELERRLQPSAGSAAPAPEAWQAWAGVRSTVPDRVPLVGPVSKAPEQQGLWMCSALGTRGLTWGLLCGELLAAHLDGDPLPMELSHARALLADRPAPGRVPFEADEG
ncbi:MAG: FAD-dependent 5-carboxymethylaminomethyl-2-thiouridine(34) oxidoreductase MnmC [Curvibacter sp.]|nr:FAD-dependent 5-carboxymethylaminomethyl-2-thiouridine(34) oxidoreductase MnmC [Curvibacter sp.]